MEVYRDSDTSNEMLIIFASLLGDVTVAEFLLWAVGQELPLPESPILGQKLPPTSKEFLLRKSLPECHLANLRFWH
jgi:hypothetical protein